MANTSIKINNSATSIIERADSLVREREDFEGKEYARSNARLYSILGEVLQMYLDASISKTLLKTTIEKMKAVLKENNIRVQTNTVALTLFVRYVFRTDRQRSMNYSRTLDAAIKNKISPSSLPQFIEDCGGVESCKKLFQKSAKTITKEEVIQKYLPQVNEVLTEKIENPLATFKVGSEFVEETYKSEFIFIIAKAEKNGNIKALSAVPNMSEGMNKWAKQKLALFLSSQQDKANKNRKATNKEKALAKVKAVSKNKTPTTVGELLTA